MKKEPKTLPEAIKIVVEIYGKNVVKDARLVNILGDVVSLEDPVAVKNILREVLKSGYGEKVLMIDPVKDDYRLRIKSYSQIISDSLGFKEVIVEYILFSIAYGVGICPETPYIKIVKAKQTVSRKPTLKRITKFENEGLVVPTNKKSSSHNAIAAVIIALVVIVAIFYSYNASENDKEQFNSMVLSGNSFFSNGEYSKAMDSYKEAYNVNYTLGNEDYQKEAFEKMDVLAGELLKKGLSDNSCLLQALDLSKSELQLNGLNRVSREKIQARIDNIENLIIEKTENGKNALITNISANNGKLDEIGTAQLKDLLELSPDDYWLNFILKKSNE